MVVVNGQGRLSNENRRYRPSGCIVTSDADVGVLGELVPIALRIWSSVLPPWPLAAAKPFGSGTVFLGPKLLRSP